MKSLFCLLYCFILLSGVLSQDASDATINNSNIVSSAKPPATTNSIPDTLTAMNDFYTTTEDTPLVVTDVSKGILANDSDSHHDPLKITVTSPPSSGSLDLDASSGTFAYTPNKDYNGVDSFIYFVDDGGHHNATATVNIRVLAVNDAPVAVPDSYTVIQGSVLTTDQNSGVLSNDTDVDDDRSVLIAQAVTGEGPNYGSLQLYSDGSFIYQPNKNFFGVDSFNYTVSDAQGASSKATVTISTTAICADPLSVPCLNFVDSLFFPIVQDTATINEDNMIYALNQSLISSHLDSQAALTNQITFVAGLESNPINGNIRFFSNGTYIYAPYDNYFGQDSFNYSISRSVNVNGVNQTTNKKIYTMMITVIAQQDPPVANDDYYVTNEDTNLVISTASQGILANDTDVDGDPLVITILTNPLHGRFQSFDLNTGVFTYVPDPDYNGVDWFSYRITDPASNSADAKVTISIQSVNDLPITVNDFYVIGQNQFLSANSVLANDSDKESAILTASMNSQPSHGQIRFFPNGTFAYIPAHNYVGTDSFDYNAIDADNGTTVGHVSISIFPRTSGLLIFYLIFIIFIVLAAIVLVFLRSRGWNPFNDPEISGPTKARLFDDED